MTRTDIPASWDERTSLIAVLDYARATARSKCEGLSDEQARTVLVPSSPLTNIASLISHLHWVEFDWIETVFFGRPEEGRTPWDDEEDPDAEMTAGLHTPLSTLLTQYEEQCERFNSVFAEHDLDEFAKHTRPNREPVTLRWIILHLIEETSRHNGHIDIIRELLDGRTGR